MSTAATALDIPELHFVAGLPGFDAVHRFNLVRWGDAGFFAVMKGIEDPAAEFVVVPPSLFFPHYAPEIDDAVAERLALESADDVLLLVVVTLGDRAEDATANLLAPIVVNRHTREAAQVVLTPGEGEDFPLRAPLAQAG